MLKSKITYTVIIPLYNKESYIVRCLNSLTSQTMPPNEIIIVDDRSTDSSYLLTKQFIDNYKSDNTSIILLENKINSGPGVTRNLGIENANGDFLLFLDADDTYEANHIKNINNVIQEFDASIVITQVRHNPSGRVLPSKKIINLLKQLNSISYEIIKPIEIMSSEMIFVSANYCFNRQEFENLRFESERNFEDWLFCYQLIKLMQKKNSKLILIKDATYNYSEDVPFSLSSNKMLNADNFVLPKLYYILNNDKNIKLRKLIFSIWFFNAVNRLNSFSARFNLLKKYKFEMINNLSVNKYFLSSLIFMLLPPTLRSVLINLFRNFTKTT